MSYFRNFRRFLQSPRGLWRWFALAMTTAILCSNFVWMSAALGQIPGGFLPAVSGQENSSSNPLEHLQQSLSLDGDFVVRGIYLDGRRIFDIAVPASKVSIDSLEEAEESTTSTSISNRAEVIQGRVREVAQDNLSRSSLTIDHQIDPDNQLPRIMVNGSYLMTVTTSDAEVQGDNLDTTTQEIIQTINDALRNYKRERQPDYLRRQGLIAGGFTAGMMVLTISLLYRQRQLKAQYKQVLAEIEKTESTVMPSPDPDANTDTTLSDQAYEQAHKQLAKNKRLKVWLELRQRLLTIGLIGIWTGGVALVLRLFPQTRWLQSLVLSGLGQVLLKIVITIAATYWAIRITFVLVDWVFTLLGRSSLLSSHASVRKQQRLNTVAGIAKGIISILMAIIGFLIALSTLGVNIGPLLTGVGIIGVAISLGAQNLVKDMINGFFILLEDQFSVGDVITIGDASGFVERMNLRITQLRSIDGELITVPNSSISEVRNHTNKWSRANLAIAVGYHTDLDHAIAIIDDVAQEMNRVQPWQELILEPPTVLGVDEFNENHLTIRLWIKTKPLEQWDVGREYRRRLKKAFDREGISIPLPHRTIQLESPRELSHFNGGKETSDIH